LILYFFKAAGKTFQHGSSSVTLKLCAAFAAASRALSLSRVDTTAWGRVGLVLEVDVTDAPLVEAPRLLFCVREVDAVRVMLAEGLFEAFPNESADPDARRETGGAWMGTGFEPVPAPFVLVVDACEGESKGYAAVVVVGVKESWKVAESDESGAAPPA
jgi:hypothetical protein